MEARKVIAQKYSTAVRTVKPQDVVVTSGCSGALELAIRTLCGPGDNIVLPRPAFELYRCLSESIGVQCRRYNLVPQQQWEADLESKIDANTKLITITNPLNPCGSVYSEDHLQKLIRIASIHRVTVLTDEIYENMTFAGAKFHHAASGSEDVPIITCGGISKRYMIPGWRLGWIVLFDNPQRSLEKAGVHDALAIHAHSVGSACTVVQSTLHKIICNTPQQFYAHSMQTIQESAEMLYSRLSCIDGLSPVKPQGALYIMIAVSFDRFRDINSDAEFTEKLLAEQSVFALPGKVYQSPQYVRMTAMRCLVKSLQRRATE